MSAAWHTCISATDASLFGLGAYTVTRCGRIAEKWRFKTKDFVQARLSCLDAAFQIADQTELANELAAEHGAFAEVPRSIFGVDGWKLVYAPHAGGGDRILHLEGRGLYIRVKHLLLSSGRPWQTVAMSG